MKERPILFSAPMVRALLDDSKTQTRRVLKPQPVDAPANLQVLQRIGGGPWLPFIPDGKYQGWCATPEWRCPYGATGDRLWVRETWRPYCAGPISPEFPLGTCVRFAADLAVMKPELWNEEQGSWCEAHEEDGRWRPSIFMPRWASRITLEITNIRVERVQEITNEDAAAEGVDSKEAYESLWSTLNKTPGKRWENNPWVWVITFKKL